MRTHRHLLTLLLLAAALTAGAQSVFVHMGRVVVAASAQEVSEMTFTHAGAVLQMGDTAFNVADIDSLIVTPATETISDVLVAYDNAGAVVTIPLALTKTVNATVQDNAYVTVNSFATGGDDVHYTLSGTSGNGAFTMNGKYKCRIVLNGLALTSQKGAAIDIQNGKRIDIELADGTDNTLCDATGGAQKACFFVKGHPEFSGGGTLSITGKTKHAFASNEYTRLKKSTGTIRIDESASDAMHCGQYFRMDGGTLIVGEKVLGDGVQAEITKDATDEYNGQMIINGGSISITLNGDDVKGLRSDSAMTITGGSIDISANGAGTRGIACDGNLTINENTGTTAITVRANGGVYTNPNDKTDTSKCMGIRVDGNMTITAGTITVTATGTKAKTIKVSGLYTKSGTAVVNAANMDI